MEHIFEMRFASSITRVDISINCNFSKGLFTLGATHERSASPSVWAAAIRALQTGIQ